MSKSPPHITCVGEALVVLSAHRGPLETVDTFVRFHLDEQPVLPGIPYQVRFDTSDSHRTDLNGKERL